MTTNGYNHVEDALVDVLDGMADFDKEGDNQNLYQSDYRGMRLGHSVMIVLEPGTIPTHDTAQFPRRMRTVWTVNIRIFVRFDKDLTEINRKIRDLRQKVMNHLDRYPTLNSTVGVIFARLTGGSEPDIHEGKSNNWWSQQLNFQIEERYTATIA